MNSKTEEIVLEDVNNEEIVLEDVNNEEIVLEDVRFNYSSIDASDVDFAYEYNACRNLYIEEKSRNDAALSALDYATELALEVDEILDDDDLGSQ